MQRDDREIRTTNNRGLVGYRGKIHGKPCIAIMCGKGQQLNDSWKCRGYISLDELLPLLKSGPYLNLDDFEI